MKENINEFETDMSVGEAASLFQRAVKKRPLKLKIAPFKFFTPTPNEDPFAEVDGSIEPDFAVGAIFQFPGPDPAMGSVIMSCLKQDNGIRVLLTSTGNIRGRVVSNSLLNHILGEFQSADSGIVVDRYTGRR